MELFSGFKQLSYKAIFGVESRVVFGVGEAIIEDEENLRKLSDNKKDGYRNEDGVRNILENKPRR